MMNELNALEDKIARVTGLCRALHAENMQLKERLVVAEEDKTALMSRMEIAREQLEQLARKLPEAKSAN